MGFPYQAVTKTVTGTSAAYSANQSIGGLQFFDMTPKGGFLQSVNINLNSTNASQVDFCMFYSSMPNTTFTDHSSIAISSADFASLGPVISVTNWAYMGVNATAGFAGGLAYAFNSYSVSSNGMARMYWALVARGATSINSATGVSVTLTYVS